MPTPRWLKSLFRKLGYSSRPMIRSRRALRVESLEDRSVPALAASGAAVGELPVVRTFDDVTLSPVSAFFAFDPSFRGGVNVALGDVTGDGTADIIAGTASGAPAAVRVFDGATGAEVRSFLAFNGAAFGINVASGDVDGDGRDDIVVSTNERTSAVRVFSGATGAELTSFFAFDPAITSGVKIAIADVDGDGRDDIVTGIGAGGVTAVRTFNGATGGEISSFIAGPYDGEISLAAGDVNGDGRAEILVGIADGIPVAALFDGLSGAVQNVYLPFGLAANQGLSVGIGPDSNGDGRNELIFGANGTQVVGTVDAISGALLNVGVLPVVNVGNLSGPPLSPPSNPTPAANNAPTITSSGGGSSATDSVNEGSTQVTTVTANDTDANATLTFSIAGGDDASLFSIDPNTGVLSFVTPPDFENPADAGANNVYDVTVRVSDGTLFDDQALAITVTDENDNAPAITSNASANVAENTTSVLTVTATDADAGTTLTYSIIGGVDSSLFGINASTGTLTFNSAMDFENPADAGANNVYDVIVRVSDGTLFDDQAIAVTITDTNDNTPAITSNGGGTTGTASVIESTTAVTTVTATDGDAGSTLTYSIVGGADSSLFGIDANTGVLTFTAAPDAENPTDAGANNVYDVTVQVSDGTNTDTQAIAVTVTDANDNIPTITSNGGGPTATVSVVEGSTAVTTVTATDADTSAALTYSIIGGVDSSLFGINASTGVLTFLSAPSFASPADSGGNNVYDVTVQVTDGAFTDTQTIAVTVTEANVAPVVTTSAGTTAYTVNAPGVIIDAAVTVTDANSSDMIVGATVGDAGGFAPGDVLSFDSALAAGFGISGSYDGVTTGVLTFTGSATPAQYQAVLRTVTFATSVDVSVTLTFTFTVNDGDTTGSGTKNVAVTSTT